MISDTSVITFLTSAISGAWAPKVIFTSRPRMSLVKTQLPAVFIAATYEEDYKAPGVSVCNSCTKCQYKIVGLFSLPSTGTVHDAAMAKIALLSPTLHVEKLDGNLCYPGKTFFDQELVLDSGEPVYNVEFNLGVNLIG